VFFGAHLSTQAAIVNCHDDLKTASQKKKVSAHRKENSRPQTTQEHGKKAIGVIPWPANKLENRVIL